MITLDQLQFLAPRPHAGEAQRNWDGYTAVLVEHGPALCAEFGIDRALELQHFLAQVLHETGGLTVLWESMHYSHASRIIEIFGVGRHSAAITEAEAQHLVGKAQALAERVYGLGNPRKARELGNIEPGDGYRYRGFGPMQTTGRAAHEKYLGGETTFLAALRAAFAEWDEKGCNALACADDIKTITRRINGGYNGLAERRQWLAKCKRTWPQLAADAPPPIEAAPAPEPDTAAAASALDLPIPTSIDDLVHVSRKYGLLERIKLALGVTATGAGGVQLAGPSTNGAFDGIRDFMAAHVLELAFGACLLGIVLTLILQKWIADDHRSGRYVPSRGP